MKLLFVCTGNTCRSPMAKALMQKILHEKQKDSDQSVQKIEVSSAGIHALPEQPASKLARKVLKQIYGIEFNKHKSQRINNDLVRTADWVITMTAAQKILTQQLFPEFESKIKTLGELAETTGEDVDDPFGGSFELYEQTAKNLYRLLLNLAERLEYL